MVKRMVMEAATGQSPMSPLQFAAAKEILTNLDPEWGVAKIKVDMPDPREAAAVEATVSILLRVLKGPPGAPLAHDLPPPGLPGPEDENSEPYGGF